MAASQSSRRPAAGLPRRPWLRALAILLGVVVLLAHTVTLLKVRELPALWHMDWPDLYKHFALISAFALAYRLSFRGRAPGADIISIYYCSGWAALCEISQHWIHGRDFSPLELTANVLTPIAIVGLLRLLSDWPDWFS